MPPEEGGKRPPGVQPLEHRGWKGVPVTVNDAVYALCFIFPAYCANAVPVILGGGTPIDGGRAFWDGRPILGPRKTIRGFLAGLIVGTLVGVLEAQIFSGFPLVFSGFSQVFLSTLRNPLLGFTLSLGALVGDLAESFFKRRLGLPPGARLPVADQLDFVAGALLLSSLAVSPPSLPVALIILVVTPPIHLFTNGVAYRLGLKKEPW